MGSKEGKRGNRSGSNCIITGRSGIRSGMSVGKTWIRTGTKIGSKGVTNGTRVGRSGHNIGRRTGSNGKSTGTRFTIMGTRRGISIGRSGVIIINTIPVADVNNSVRGPARGPTTEVIIEASNLIMSKFPLPPPPRSKQNLT